MKNFQNLEVSFLSVDSFSFLWKSGLIPWTKTTMGGKCLIWAAKHIFSPVLWFTWNRHVFHENVVFSLYFFWSENENNYKEKFCYGESIDKKDNNCKWRMTNFNVILLSSQQREAKQKCTLYYLYAFFWNHWIWVHWGKEKMGKIKMKKFRLIITCIFT